MCHCHQQYHTLLLISVIPPLTPLDTFVFGKVIGELLCLVVAFPVILAPILTWVMTDWK